MGSVSEAVQRDGDEASRDGDEAVVTAAFVPEVADEGVSLIRETASASGLYMVRIDVPLVSANGEPLEGAAKLAARLASHPVAVYAGSEREAEANYRDATGHEIEPLVVEVVR